MNADGRPPQDGLPEAVLFDLDGTLIDSVPDIAAATNELLAHHGLESLRVDEVRLMVGHGVTPLVQRAFAARSVPLDGEALTRRVAEMMPIYGRHLVNLTVVLPGASTCLETLAQAGVKLAVVSNKPMPFTQAICDHYGFSRHLAAVQGAVETMAKKPAPDMLHAVLDAMGAGRDRAVMVGDGEADVKAARAAGLPVVILRGGYGAESAESLAPDLVVDSLADLTPALRRLHSRLC
ncbi:HAD family hydrolase [Aquibium carbonis]|uniref:phosphoglycolate phosphatase n=1 Tax=Aquibium carbonis TaxID=2495581 RepID=A0A3R9Y7G2_9HYPH|nr:HAD-IA family hydrolase [Aquibium carbonis]RST85838.1 HAD family hydrolase [Aquibium carbonis]